MDIKDKEFIKMAKESKVMAMDLIVLLDNGYTLSQIKELETDPNNCQLQIKKLKNKSKVKTSTKKKVVEKNNETFVIETIEKVTIKYNPIAEYESRFKEIANLDGDLTHYPLDKNNPNHHLQVVTNKEKSDAHGEVFTPLWLVDEMVEKLKLKKGNTKTTLDLCSGYGQFTIRLLRAKCELVKTFSQQQINKFLNDTHSFSEFQNSSCYKLLYIFGTDINLFMGDARHLNELEDNDKDVMVYDTNFSKWVGITDDVKLFFNLHTEYNEENELKFEKMINKLLGIK